MRKFVVAVAMMLGLMGAARAQSMTCSYNGIVGNPTPPGAVSGGSGAECYNNFAAMINGYNKKGGLALCSPFFAANPPLYWYHRTQDHVWELHVVVWSWEGPYQHCQVVEDTPVGVTLSDYATAPPLPVITSSTNSNGTSTAAWEEGLPPTMTDTSSAGVSFQHTTYGAEDFIDNQPSFTVTSTALALHAEVTGGGLYTGDAGYPVLVDQNNTVVANATCHQPRPPQQLYCIASVPATQLTLGAQYTFVWWGYTGQAGTYTSHIYTWHQ
jgi:hypothetical protein